jgi:uncharacterized membrane protein YwzB
MRALSLLVLPALALLLLAAHLMHAGLLPLAIVAVLLVGLLAVRRPWAARTVQAILAVAVIEWVLTAITRAQLRMQHGDPYLRLVLILGAVALFTAVAAAIFQHPALRARFRLDGAAGAPTDVSPG